MPKGPILTIRQKAPINGKYPICLTLKRPGQPELEADAMVEFALTAQEQEDLRWYFEDYLGVADTVEEIVVGQVENFMKKCGVELYEKMLESSRDVRRLFNSVLAEFPDLRVEINTEIAEAASIPWELMRDPQSDSAIALRVKSFVRVQSNPNLSFVPVPALHQGRIRLLYVVSRPGGTGDVPLRAVVNRLLRDLGSDLARFEIKALRPPTFEQLQKELQDAKEIGHQYHIVHFDGHGSYVDLSETSLAGWLTRLPSAHLGGMNSGKRGYLSFEHPDSEAKSRPVSGDELGKLLHDNGVPILVVNACESAMHEAAEKPEGAENVHDEVRAVGSLAQAVVDQGIPAVLGMRYSVFVVAAAQYIGELYASLAKGRSFGQAATEARKHLHRNPDRWVGVRPRPLQDWFVPIVYEAAPLRLVMTDEARPLGQQPEMDPVQRDISLVRYVPDYKFVGRDETLLMLDRAFDNHSVVLLHAYAGQGKTATAVEFARWYARTGGLGSEPFVLLTSFEFHTDLSRVLDQIGRTLAPVLQANAIDWNTLNESSERRKLVLQILRQIPVLWIWDNVDPVAGFPRGVESLWTVNEQTELADFLKQIKLDDATKARILLTSRTDEQTWLGGIPYRVRMHPMSPADSAALVLKLGEEKGVMRSAIYNWQPLIAYCFGNPLTLRVIAGQVVQMNLRTKDQIAAFIQALREGEQLIEDKGEEEGRDKSLTTSLEYGFQNAFTPEELPVIALLHFFQGTVNVDMLWIMGNVGDHVLPEIQKKSKEDLRGFLERARDIGLLTHLGSSWYSIHPALPWFLRHLFAEQYSGIEGRSEAQDALRAWVSAVGNFGNYCHDQFDEGNQDWLSSLAIMEANLLHARRLAIKHGWWSPVIATMQGLRTLYGLGGFKEEWARLVMEIVPYYCTTDYGPLSGREDAYSLVMEYRVRLARDDEHDLTRAATLQERLVEWTRYQAASHLVFPEDAPLDDIQRNRIRTLSVNLIAFGKILFEQGNSDCVKQYEEALQYYLRIRDISGEAAVHFNLGQAYLVLTDIRDLDLAEAAYRRSLALYDPNDTSGRLRCIAQIGMVYFSRFKKGREEGEPEETLKRYWFTAEHCYQNALSLGPCVLIDIQLMYGQLANLYVEVNQLELAREYYEKLLQVCNQTGDRYLAGQTRLNMARMYILQAEREIDTEGQRNALGRSRAYAQAALNDFQHYSGRCAAEEAKAQQFLEDIERGLSQLPQ